MVMRQYDRLHFVTLWAEDYVIYFIRSAVDGIFSIFLTMGGYFHVFPQIISWVSYQISLAYYPVLTLIIATFIYAYTISLVLKPSYAWISSNLWVRFFIVLCLSVVPGIPEVIGNLANLHSVLFLFVSLRLISDLNEKYTIIDYLLFIFAAVSTGEFFLIMPVLLFRFYVFYKAGDRAKIIQTYFLLALVVLSLTISFKAFTTSGIYHDENISRYFSIFFEYKYNFLLTVINRMVYLPFLGNLTILINQHLFLAIGLGSLILLFFLANILYFKMYDKSFILLVLTLFSQATDILLTVFVRPGSENTPYIGQLISIGDQSIRYMIIMMPFVVIFWQVLFKKLLVTYHCKDRNIAVFLVLVSILFIFNNSQRIIFSNFYCMAFTPELEKKLLWPNHLDGIRRAINDGKINDYWVPIAPLGWWPNNK